MLDTRTEQRVNIKFLVKLEKTAIGTFNLLREAYEENTLPRSRVSEWHKRWSEGGEDVEDDDETDKNVGKVKTLVGNRSSFRHQTNSGGDECMSNGPKESATF